MSFDAFYQRFVAFGVAFALSLFAAGFLYRINLSDIFKKELKSAPKIVPPMDNGMADAACNPTSEKSNITDKTTGQRAAKATGVKILSKPRAAYTNEARDNQVQGKVLLRVTFSANGTIGAIAVINGLPDGLTEAAKEAAKGIKFKPAARGGAPYSVTKPVEYTFTIY